MGLEEKVKVLEKYILVLEGEVESLNEALAENKDYLIDVLNEKFELADKVKQLEEELNVYKNKEAQGE